MNGAEGRIAGLDARRLLRLRRVLEALYSGGGGVVGLQLDAMELAGLVGHHVEAEVEGQVDNVGVVEVEVEYAVDEMSGCGVRLGYQDSYDSSPWVFMWTR